MKIVVHSLERCVTYSQLQRLIHSSVVFDPLVKFVSRTRHTSKTVSRKTPISYSTHYASTRRPLMTRQFIATTCICAGDGCPDLDPLPHIDIHRTPASAVLECLTTGEKWHLVCRGTEWIGEMGNCSTAQRGTVELLMAVERGAKAN